MRMRISRKDSGVIGRYAQTRQRQALLDIIREMNRHVDAKELIKIAVNRDSSISPATVYRNLKLFRELELIDEKRIGQSRCFFELKHTQQHQHLVCSKCGKIVDFDCPITEVISKVKQEKGFVVTRAEVCLEGLCSECSRRNGVPGNVALVATRD
jgi:Fe2+ or Zn2+ uptake regulation protein